MQGRRVWVARGFSVLLMAAFLAPMAGSVYGGSSAGSEAVASFTIKYCVHESYSGEWTYNSDSYLVVHSNGTATYRVNDFVWNATLSSDLVNQLYNIMVGEEFSSLDSSYADLGWGRTMNHTERACLEISGVNKTVTFEGNSMMGVIPGSFAILNNIASAVNRGLADLPNAALEMGVKDLDIRTRLSEITANMTNSGKTVLQDSGLCNTSWPIFIVSVNGTTVADAQARVMPYCRMQFDPDTTTDFGPWKWNRTDVPADRYVIMSRVVVWDFITGNITADSAWISDKADKEPVTNGPDTLLIVVSGIAVASSAGVVVLAFLLIRRKVA